MRTQTVVTSHVRVCRGKCMDQFCCRCIFSDVSAARFAVFQLAIYIT
jgi:hypothetical protein